jgi:hypothetical protein
MHPVSRRRFLEQTSTISLGLLATGLARAAGQAMERFDVCIYGGTSGGVIAAATLARQGRSVLLIEPTRHVGGMTAGGLGWVDYGKAETIGGLTRQFFTDIANYYRRLNVPTNGWSVEPHVAELFFEKLLDNPLITVLREARLSALKKNGRRIETITLDKALVQQHGAPASTPLEERFYVATAAIYIDCSYEGDLMAQAGVPYWVGREGENEYHENLAGFRINSLSAGIIESGRSHNASLRIDPYVRRGDSSSGLIRFVSDQAMVPTGSRQDAVQAYTFRLCLSKENCKPIDPPSNYEPNDYEIVRRYVDALKTVGAPLWRGDLYYNFGLEKRYGSDLPRLLKITRLMRGKTDVNNSGPVSIDYVNGASTGYVCGDWPTRAKIWRNHEDYIRGFLYFLRTDERLPDWLRNETILWGLSQDEFKDTKGWPHQLYVREARRMRSGVVMDQSSCERGGDPETSIGIGSYALDSHQCERFQQDGMIVGEGSFFRGVKPYSIPFSAICPAQTDCENLLVTCCLSSTHVAYASLRMEPVFMILSESAAVAADLALVKGCAVQQVSIDQLKKQLTEQEQLI